MTTEFDYWRRVEAIDLVHHTLDDGPAFLFVFLPFLVASISGVADVVGVAFLFLFLLVVFVFISCVVRSFVDSYEPGNE